MAKKTSKYWKKKADGVITKIFSGQPCIICKLLGRINIINTCGHHLIGRGNAFSRHALLNIIPLCPLHHKFSNELAAHSSNAFAVQEFIKIVKQELPAHYAYWIKNQHKIGIKMDYEAIYKDLKNKWKNEFDKIEEVIYGDLRKG